LGFGMLTTKTDTSPFHKKDPEKSPASFWIATNLSCLEVNHFFIAPNKGERLVFP